MSYLSSEKQIDHRVALVRCNAYENADEGLSYGIGLLGGIHQFCSPGETLLLKPNLLLGDKPDRGSTTHPVIFEAVARLFQSGGASLAYGDSPCFGSPISAVRSSGLHNVAESLGIELADFLHEVDCPNSQGKLLKQFQIASGLLNMDGVINLPKFKAHGLTRLTGAVKNLFGCLPGVQKTGFHARLPDESQFGEMLVDLAELISPRLHILDGVFGMEGNGPRNGDVRLVGVILLSKNPHALDHCMARIMDLDPMLVPTLKAAQERGLYCPDEIEVLGEKLEDCILQDFNVNHSRASTTGTHGFYMELFKNWVTPRPVIDPGQCSSCGRCVSVCPAEPKAISFLNGRKQPPDYDYHKCIRCYCCQEMCPDEAITIHTPVIGRFLNKINL